MLTPGLYVTPDYGPGAKLAILAAGALAASRRFRVPQNDDLFTRDPEVLDWIRSDRLGARTLTARCLLQMGRMGARIRRDVGQLRAPLLVMAAGRDRIADNDRSRRLLQSRLGARCHWVTFDAEHFLLAEPCRGQVIAALLDWIEREGD
jgi:alpha-beta hydrolase superfamily lysophospholipase